MFKQPFVPAFLFLGVLGLALLLIVGMVVRPWEMATASAVDVIAAAAPDKYNRSTLDYVGSTREIVGFEPAPLTAAHPSRSGKDYYVTYGCANCHGLEGKGSTWAPLRTASKEMVSAMVRLGPKNMPSFTKSYLPDDVVDQIAAWLLAQQPKAAQPPAPASPPASSGTPPTPETTAGATVPSSRPAQGDTTRGQAVYAGLSCVACHGATGAGTGIAPAVNGSALAARFPADAAVADLMRKGKGMMPGFDARRLPASDLADVIAYMRSLK